MGLGSLWHVLIVSCIVSLFLALVCFLQKLLAAALLDTKALIQIPDGLLQRCYIQLSENGVWT